MTAVVEFERLGRDESKFGSATIFKNGDDEFLYITKLGPDAYRILSHAANDVRDLVHVDTIISKQKSNERFKLPCHAQEKTKIEQAAKFFNGTTADFVAAIVHGDPITIRDVRFALGQVNRVRGLLKFVAWNYEYGDDMKDLIREFSKISRALVDLHSRRHFVQDTSAVILGDYRERKGKRGPENEMRNKNIKFTLRSDAKADLLLQLDELQRLDFEERQEALARHKLLKGQSGTTKKQIAKDNPLKQNSLNKAILQMMLSKEFKLRIDLEAVEQMNKFGRQLKDRIIRREEKHEGENVKSFILESNKNMVIKAIKKIIREEPLVVAINDMEIVKPVEFDEEIIKEENPIVRPTPAQLTEHIN